MGRLLFIAEAGGFGTWTTVTSPLGWGALPGVASRLRFDVRFVVFGARSFIDVVSCDLSVEDEAVCSHRVEREQVKKSLRGLLAGCSGIVVADEMIRGRCWDGRMFKDAVCADNSTLWHPRRNENGRHANAKTVEVEGKV